MRSVRGVRCGVWNRAQWGRVRRERGLEKGENETVEIEEEKKEMEKELELRAGLVMW